MVTLYLYIYDIVKSEEKEYMRIKRKFYYHLNKLRNKYNISFINKSTIVCDREIDFFFESFKSEDIICFKVVDPKIIKLK